MPHVDSTYEAKARFSEVLRQVRAGQRVRVTYRGREVAEIRPQLEARLNSLEAEGIIGPAGRRRDRLASLATKEGALKRFLDSRG